CYRDWSSDVCSSDLIVWLREHRLRAKRTESDDLVFGNRKGQPLRESKLLRNVLQPAAERAGLGRVTWHQFRHIHSSLLNDLRVRSEERRVGKACRAG